MALSPSEIRNLRDLASRMDTAVELVSRDEKYMAYWSSLASRGYVVIRDSAICGFERVQGTYVSITEAGRLCLENIETFALDKEEVMIVNSAMARVKNDNLERNCTMTPEFEALLGKIESAVEKG